MAACPLAERLGLFLDKMYVPHRDRDAAVSALLTSLATARSAVVRSACARAVSKLYWSVTSPAPSNEDAAVLIAVALCQAIRIESDRDVRLAIIDAIGKQGQALHLPALVGVPQHDLDPNADNKILFEFSASDDVSERRAAQGAILCRIDDFKNQDEGVAARKAFARDRSEFALFLEGNRQITSEDWSRLVRPGETQCGWIEDALGPPDDPADYDATSSTSVWKYNLGQQANRLFAFHFDPTTKPRILKSSGYE